MDLLPADVRKHLPPLYSQEHVKDPLIPLKLFTPDSSWTWFVIEGSTHPDDPEDFLFFGFVVGLFPELGYFCLSELQSVRGPFGLAVERDLWWTPCKLSEVQA